MKMKKGCRIPFSIAEGYALYPDRIVANVGTDKIEALLQDFIFLHDEPLFFILELPSNAADEAVTQDCLVNGFHQHVYYIDGCSQEKARAILSHTGKLLYEDGMATFGFGCHRSGDEILFGKYNVLTILSRQSAQYHDFFAARGIVLDDHLRTAWDGFSQEHPGESFRVTVDGKDVYSLPEELDSEGLYLAEQRP